MIHFTNPDFWNAYNTLPTKIQKIADQNFKLLKENPAHPSLSLKEIGRFWSARVGLRYRALAVKAADSLIWFWIGSHADYDKLLTETA